MSRRCRGILQLVLYLFVLMLVEHGVIRMLVRWKLVMLLAAAVRHFPTAAAANTTRNNNHRRVAS